MHILILPMYYPEPGSPPHRGYMFYEQAMQLAQAGCRVGLAYTEQRLLKEFTWKKFRKESHCQITEENNGSFTTLRMHAWNPKLSTRIGGIIWSLLTLLLVHNYIRRHGRPDIIHAHFGIWAGYAANLVYKCYGIPYVVTEHASSIGSKKVTKVQGATLRAAYKNAKTVICVGTQLKNSIIEQHLASAQKTIVLPNFVDISTFHLSSRHTDKEKEFTFVSVGNLVKLKGFDLLIEAFAKSFRNCPQVSLVIAGDGEEATNLQDLIHKLRMESQVTLAGRLPREEVAQLLARSDAFALASYIETFGIVFIEAMATGIPVIGTACGGPTDIIIPSVNGYLAPTGEVDVLAEKMCLLYNNYEQFDKELIRQSVAERFDFKLAGQKLKEIYQQ